MAPRRSRGFCGPEKISRANINADNIASAACHPLATHRAFPFDRSVDESTHTMIHSRNFSCDQFESRTHLIARRMTPNAFGRVSFHCDFGFLVAQTEFAQIQFRQSGRIVRIRRLIPHLHIVSTHCYVSGTKSFLKLPSERRLILIVYATYLVPLSGGNFSRSISIFSLAMACASRNNCKS